ncbi:hypothetical protein LOTGIDRAFT_176314, partial [Lottia gigantea]
DGINWKISNQSDYIVLPLDSKIWRSYLYGISVHIDDSSSDESKVKTLRVDSAKEQYLFNDLASVNYSISLQAYSVAGAGPESSAVFAVPLKATTDTGWNLKWIIIVTVVLSVVSFIFCLFFCNRKRICKLKRYKIKTPINKSLSNQSPMYCGLDTNSPTYDGVPSTPNIEILNEEEILTVDRKSNSAKLSNTKNAFNGTKTQDFLNPMFTTSNGYCPNDTFKSENNTHEQLNTAISNNTHISEVDLHNCQTTNQLNNLSSNISSCTLLTVHESPDLDETKCTDENILRNTTCDDLDRHGFKDRFDSSLQVNADHKFTPEVAEVNNYIQVDQVKDVLPNEASVIGSDHKVSSDPGVAEVNDYIQVDQMPISTIITQPSLSVGEAVEYKPVGLDSKGTGSSSVSSYVTVGLEKDYGNRDSNC